MLDRWSIKVTNDSEESEDGESGKICDYQDIPFNIINNYFSIGVVRKSDNSINRLILP